MRKNKPIIFWLFAMENYQRESIIGSVDYFNKNGVKFITIDYDENGFSVNTYNLTENESEQYLDNICSKISSVCTVKAITKSVVYNEN